MSRRDSAASAWYTWHLTTTGEVLHETLDVSVDQCVIVGRVFSKYTVFSILPDDFFEDVCTIESKASFPGKLEYNGVSFGGGLGVGIMLTRSFMLSAEAIGSFGVASWEVTPFANSSSDDFDPSQYGMLINLSFFFGEGGT